MKIFFLIFALTSALFSCKKETSNTTNSNTTNNPSNSLVCVDNPNINFSSIGTPIGKFSDCIKDVDGNIYKTVTIGTQTWMAENLKASKYNDGTTIPNVKDSLEWSKLTTGAWCYYNNDEKNNAKYGKLYNWYAVSKTSNGNKNVCPTGWHVPTDAEWEVLSDYLGGNAGGKLKEVDTINWNSPNKQATNMSLFSALPGGYRDSIGYDYDSSLFGYWWSSTESSARGAWFRLLYFYLNQVNRFSFTKDFGLSVRCIKD